MIAISVNRYPEEVIKQYANKLKGFTISRKGFGKYKYRYKKGVNGYYNHKVAYIFICLGWKSNLKTVLKFIYDLNDFRPCS